VKEIKKKKKKTKLGDKEERRIASARKVCEVLRNGR
jgi:hypothetical protein